VSWDPTWEGVFRSRKWGRYPPEELIRFVATCFDTAPDRQAVRILEVGCGPGANLWYLAREGFSVVGIDGSETALRYARERLHADGLRAELVRGDFTQLGVYFEPGSFDAIVDVAALQHNDWEGMRRAVAEMRQSLRLRGQVFAMLVAAGSWGDGLGQELESGTYSDISAGPLAGVGACHFFDLADVERLFAEFDGLQIEYSERSLDDRRHSYRHWVVSAVRPE
jgi:SAM-dependent methyltransferase